jgi:NAD(P)-dependent dehydrogenase (short-subunit alcohol dehydrogenase family)
MNQITSQHLQNRQGLLHDKVAIITGASRGIGAAAARLFAREGAIVTLIARTESSLAALTEEIRAAGGQADYVTANLAEAGSIEHAVQTTLDRYGRLDIAFNNAGAAIPPGPLAETEEQGFDFIQDVNYKAIWRAMVAEIRAIRSTSGRGAIVNTSSVGSLQGNPALSLYGAAKRAVNSLTQTAAIEYGPEDIRVNAIAPGTTMTEMIQGWESEQPGVIDHLNSRTPLRRAAEPEEIAEAAAWLLSDRAAYVTGVILPVDGGLSA